MPSPTVTAKLINWKTVIRRAHHNSFFFLSSFGVCVMWMWVRGWKQGQDVHAISIFRRAMHPHLSALHALFKSNHPTGLSRLDCTLKIRYSTATHHPEPSVATTNRSHAHTQIVLLNISKCSATKKEIIKEIIAPSLFWLPPKIYVFNSLFAFSFCHSYKTHFTLICFCFSIFFFSSSEYLSRYKRVNVRKVLYSAICWCTPSFRPPNGVFHLLF